MTKAWPPTRHSPPLSKNFPSLFDRYKGALQIAWKSAMGHELDAWQVSLLRAITELYPKSDPRAGQLRWRQVLISVARQNGKTELVAALGLMFLLARADGLIIGIASSAEQAGLTYRRAMRVINRNNALAKRFYALTETRGITAKNGSRWELKASKSAALQGPPIDLGAVDEVHLVKPDLWNDLVNGTGGRPDTLVVGITTAGDDNSTLLKTLYEATESGPARFGHFIWEAPESRMPDDDATLLKYLKAANPALACGRLDAENIVADVRAMQAVDAVRYRLNRFVSATAAFIDIGAWQACARDADSSLPEGGGPVFAIDRTPDWAQACVTANVKDADGLLWSEVAASMVRPDIDRLEALCMALGRHPQASFVMDGYALKELGRRLKKRGFAVHVLTQGDIVSASSLFYAKVAQRGLRHASDPLLTAQIPRTSRKNIGTAFRISRADSSAEIDAVMSTAMGAYIAETAEPVEDQLFT